MRHPPPPATEICVLQRLVQSTERDLFPYGRGNMMYVFQLLLGHINELEESGPVQQEIIDMKRQAIAWHSNLTHLNNCNRSVSLLCFSTTHLECAAPKLFIMLLPDLDHWNDQDPVTHVFRLYFLCDSSHRPHPEHIHLLSHPGYVLNRQTEFIQTYGEYVLTFFLTVRGGFSYGDSYRSCNVPKLHTNEILNDCEGIETQHQLTKESIGAHVKKAIDHLETVVPISKFAKLSEARETGDIQSFLHLEEGDNGMASLYRT